MNKWNIIAGLMVCMLWVGTLQAQEKKNNRRISQKLTLAEYAIVNLYVDETDENK